MYYEAFLLFLSQIHSEHQAKIFLGDQEVFIDLEDQSGCWTLSSTLCEESPNYLSEMRMGFGVESLMQKLENVDGRLRLTQKISPIKGYKSFKTVMADYIEQIHLWQDFLLPERREFPG